MTSISDGFSQELSQIIEAVRPGQITASESEGLIGERYQIAMMQFQVFSALHSALQHDLDKARSVQPVLIGSERQRLEPLLARLHRNRQRLVVGTEKGKFGEKLVRKLATQQSRLMAELIVATSRFQAELYAVLTPERRTKVDDARLQQFRH
jgi:hypothetical protein